MCVPTAQIGHGWLPDLAVTDPNKAPGTIRVGTPRSTSPCGGAAIPRSSSRIISIFQRLNWGDVELHYLRESGFMARGPHGPTREGPRDWLAWHFTHIDNLPAIAAAGRLVCSAAVQPKVDVANPGVKSLRAARAVGPDEDYPKSVVNDHVPFYIAAKSPMLYAVTRGHENYQGGSDPIVFLGVVLGDVIDAGLTWCVSDSNAAGSLVDFSRDESGLSDFVDFDLLGARYWKNTADDPDRRSRRAAELLIHGMVPCELITVIVTKTDEAMRRTQACLKDVGGSRDYYVVPEMYYA